MGGEKLDVFKAYFATGYGGLTIQHEKISNTIFPTKMADRKIIVLKPRLDPTRIKLLGEKLKGRLFTKLYFLKPKPEEVRLVSVEKYYEPLIVVGGKYAIDYCKRRSYTIEVDGNAREVAFFEKKFKPEPLGNLPGSHKVIKFDGEEYFHHENEAYFVLDKMGREIDPEQLPYAPSEEHPLKELEHPLKELAKARMNLAEVKISREEKIGFLQSRIAKKPSDVGEVIKEIFEVNERDTVYSPIYQLTFQNVKTGKKKTAKINGITGKLLLPEFDEKIEAQSEDLPPLKEELVVGEPALPESPPPIMADGLKQTPRDVNKRGIEPYCFVVGDVKIPSETTMSETFVVKGHLKIGADCRILGKVKALRDIIIGANTTIEGNVVSGRNVFVGPYSFIYGSVISAGDVEIGENAVIKGGWRSKTSVALDQFAKVG